MGNKIKYWPCHPLKFFASLVLGGILIYGLAFMTTSCVSNTDTKTVVQKRVGSKYYQPVMTVTLSDLREVNFYVINGHEYVEYLVRGRGGSTFFPYNWSASMKDSIPDLSDLAIGDTDLGV